VVYTSTSTQATTAQTPAVGSTVRFVGVLFSDHGVLRMAAVAACDPAGAPPPQKH
jgi:hypothetical protein